MARRYFVSPTTADLATGVDFNLYLLSYVSSASTLSVTIAGNATELSYAYTMPLTPGLRANAYGGTALTGNFTFYYNVTTANSSTTLTMSLTRINSTGTAQTGPTASGTGAVSLATTGIKSFTWTSLSLGTFSSTDRLRLDFSYTTSTHASQTHAFGYTGTWLDAPYYGRYFLTT